MSVLKKLFKREPPLNGGNTIQVNTELVNRYETTLQYISANLDDGFTKNMYNWWELMNFQADYNTSLVRFTFEDSLLDNMFYLIFRCNFLYGNVGIIVEGDKYIPIVEGKSVVDECGNLKYIEGYSVYEMLNSAGLLQSDNINDYKIDKLKKSASKCYRLKGDDLNNYIRLYTPSYFYGAYVRWFKFIKMWDKMLKKINTYSILLTKKIMYDVNDVAAANIEIKRFYNDDYPFLINLDTATPNGNKFSVDTPENSGVEQLFFFYNEWLKIYYEMLGRRLNVDKKTERNITTEVEASQETFTILENECIINRTNFLQQFSKKTGKSVKFLDKQEEDSDSTNQSDDTKGWKEHANETKKNSTNKQTNSSDTGDNK